MSSLMRPTAGKPRAFASLVVTCLLPIYGCTPHSMAQSQLVELQKLNTTTPNVDDEAYAKDIGFKDSKDLEKAQVGSPLRVYNVRLIELQQFQRGDDPKKLLHDTQRLVFPLIVDGHIVSSFTATENKFFSAPNGWMTFLPWRAARVTRTGFPRLAQKLEELQSHHKLSESSSIVFIAPLRLLLMGDANGNPLVFTVMDDNQYLAFKSGDTRNAAELFAQLAPVAKEFYEKDQQFRRQETRQDIAR